MPARAPAQARPRAQRSSRALKRDNRALLLAAARVRLESGGLRELSVEALMGDLGFTRTAFYRYFDDLGALVAVLLSEITLPLEQAMASIASGSSAGGAASLRDALTEVAGVFAEHGRVIAAIAAAASYDEEIEAVVLAQRERFAQMAAASLDERARAAGVAISDPLETARALNLMNESYLLHAFGGERRQSVEQAVEALWPPWRELLRLPDRAAARPSPHAGPAGGARRE